LLGEVYLLVLASDATPLVVLTDALPEVDSPPRDMNIPGIVSLGGVITRLPHEGG
jgi:hypothetical protein